MINPNFAHLMIKAEIMLKGRMFNWLPRVKRHGWRNGVIDKATTDYFKHFLPAVDAVEERPAIKTPEQEKIFSLWLQGEESAPPLIKACWRSVRHNCAAQQFIPLDERSIMNYIELPDVIMDKRRRGKIGHAHFADIVRVELLHNHGGYWLDATCFVTSPIPEAIEEADFFVYSTGGVISYIFIQNCFIRSRKGAYLLEAWRAMILDYWKRDPDALTYFMHQLLFRTLVQNDPRAIARFAAMPHMDQDPTHALWWGYGNKPFDERLFREVTSGAFFQKTSHRDHWAQNPLRGSMADEMINRMYL